jgi:hypothetical protein
LNAMPTSDLNSLLLDVFREHTRRKSPADVLQSYKHNRFVQPSGIDPISFAEEEIKLLKRARDHGFEVLELSPVAPLGSCSYGFTDQNKIISGLRGTEVVADATNLMALELAIRCAKQNRLRTVDLCTAHRHVRAQTFDDKRFTAHFKVFCAASQGRDTGNFDIQIDMISHHIKLYDDYFSGIPQPIKIFFTIKSFEDEGSGSINAVARRLSSELSSLTGRVNFVAVPGADHRYYKKLRLSIDLQFENNIGHAEFAQIKRKLCSYQR